MLICSCLLITANSLSAQAFYGFQSPFGSHTFFVSLAWQGGQPIIGTGYINRISGASFTDLQAEIRFPVKDMYKFESYQAILGIYSPIALERWFVGLGAHIRLEKTSTEGQKTTQVSLALSALPTYTYGPSGEEAANGTVALRATYAPVLFAHSKGSDGNISKQAFSRHKIEAGGHADMIINRSLGLALNGIMQRSFYPAKSILEKDSRWQKEGDFYLGASYWLDRN